MHNGVIRDFARLKREMTLAINPALFGHIQGNTDSELMFMLALTFGMDSDVYAGVARMAGFVEETAAKKGIENPLQMTLAISDGKRLFAVRYSTEKQSRTLFYSASVSALRQLVPQEVEPELEVYGEQAMSVVSEPFHSLEGGWHAVAESTFLTVENGMVEQRSFVPTSV